MKKVNQLLSSLLLSFVFLIISYSSLHAAVTCPLPGDADCDNAVDGIDFSIWLLHYNETTASGAEHGDFDASGKTDGVDFSIWLANYGRSGITGTPGPTSGPVAGCSRTITSGSIQDAIDAVTDRTAPYVLCLDGTFVGGGSPKNLSRPDIGPYYGGIVIKNRKNFTLRGVNGAKILGINTDGPYPPAPDSAPVAEQHPNDLPILIKVFGDKTFGPAENITIEGLTIDGYYYTNPSTYPSGGRSVSNRLIWFQSVKNSKIRNNTIKNGGGECVRLKTNSQYNEIYHNDIYGCGHYQYITQTYPEPDGTRLRKNGEAVYIGTDPFQITNSQRNRHEYWGLDPNQVTDRSSYNKVHHNKLYPNPPAALRPPGQSPTVQYGNECVDTKEDFTAIQPVTLIPNDAARGLPGHNEVYDNDCAGQIDIESGAIGFRGPFNYAYHNTVKGPVTGYAMRIGGGDPKEIIFPIRNSDGTFRTGTTPTLHKWNAPGARVRLNQFFAYEGTGGYALRTWSAEAPESGQGVCGNTDKTGGTTFGGNFARENAATNLATCSDDSSAAGFRGCVGVTCGSSSTTPTPGVTGTRTPTPQRTGTPIPTQALTTTPIPTGSGGNPADILGINNNKWKVQLPILTDSSIDIFQPQLATYSINPFFMAAPGGGVQFRSPVNGETTPNSDYPRSELREMVDSSARVNAAWSSTSGTHTLTVDGKVTALPNTKPHLVIAQIHDGNDDVAVFRVEGTTLWITNGNTSHGYAVDTNFTLGKRYVIKYEVSGGVIKFYYNGNLLPYTQNKNFTGAYFKAGAYTQANCGNSSPCSASNYGENIIYSVTLTHQ
jgi:hypothetical protein